MTISSSEAAARADAAREQLAQTLQQLREQIAPRNLMNEMLDRVAGPEGSSLVERVESVVRDHPLPTLLIGVGAAMWFGSSWYRPVSAAVKPSGQPDSQKIEKGDEAVATAATTSGQGLSGQGLEDSLASIGVSFADSAYQRIRADAAAKLDEYAERAADSIETATNEVSHALEHSLETAVSNVSAALKRRPIATSMMALAIGAMIGNLGHNGTGPAKA